MLQCVFIIKKKLLSTVRISVVLSQNSHIHISVHPLLKYWCWPFSWRWFFPKRKPYFLQGSRILVINTYCSSNTDWSFRYTMPLNKPYLYIDGIFFSLLFRTGMMVHFSVRWESISVVKWVGCFQELMQMMFWFSKSILHVYCPQNIWMVIQMPFKGLGKAPRMY